MDGNFLPNFGMGLQDLEYIRSATTKFVDVHLMIESPSRYITLFAKKGVDIIYFHPEIDMHPARTINQIRESGVKSGIAINPGTSIAFIEPLLSLVDYVLIMTVNPGFAGQEYLSYVNTRISSLCQFKKQGDNHFKIVVDGAISMEKIKELSAVGVEGFVLGTSALFGKNHIKQLQIVYAHYRIKKLCLMSLILFCRASDKIIREVNEGAYFR